MTDLDRAQKEIETIATGELGLLFDPVEFFLVSPKLIHQIIARDGFPVRFFHWTHGMKYRQFSVQHSWGLSRILELVINNNPNYAFLMDTNSEPDQKIVFAHVYGHAHCFKNNIFLKDVQKNMIDVMATHARKIKGYYSEHGVKKVEEILDLCLSLRNQVREPKVKFADPLHGIKSPSQMIKIDYSMFPSDILLFLLTHGELEPWQADVVSMMREETCYFNPQGDTKVINEGIASYIHSRTMEEFILQPSEASSFSAKQGAVMATGPGRINPYFLGYNLLLFIEREYGREAMFEAVKNHNDYSLIDWYATKEFFLEHSLFEFKLDDKGEREIVSHEYEVVKSKMLSTLFGNFPKVHVIDRNFLKEGNLLLGHNYRSDLDLKQATDTLDRIKKVWKKHVYLITKYGDTPTMLASESAPLNHEQKEELAEAFFQSIIRA